MMEKDPADQCQIVRRVEMWYTTKDIGLSSTCILHTNLKTRFEYGISHVVCLARYYHTNGTKSLRRLRNLSNKHKLSNRNVKRMMSRDQLQTGGGLKHACQPSSP